MSFLSAEWRKLVLVNYEIDPAVLQKYLPSKTQLDTWNGTVYVSLVGFMFINTKVFGLKVPYHTNFEEVNLRFYVRYKDGQHWKRGVVFIQEIVPRHAITFIANTLYGEHYVTKPMKHHWETNDDSMITEYQWLQARKWNSITVRSERQKQKIQAGSEAEFITEHYWGYTKINDSTTYQYEVAHPPWEEYPVKDYAIDVDFGAVYGEDFSSLSNIEPKSVMLAEGSEIWVENKRKL